MESALERVLKRDRMVVAAGLALVVAIAAAYTVSGVGMNMSALAMTRMALDMPGMMMRPAQWSATYAALVFFMWWVMMIAMMVPSAAPTVLLYAAVARRQKNADGAVLATSCFLAGYLLVWAGFSVAATTLQWGLESIGVVTGMMRIASPAISGAVLIAAGVYQLTPLKGACLSHCRQPVFFLMHHWKPKAIGAFGMGLEHGAYCLGCCWFLMALLFVGGVMNLLWIAGIALLVGVEKLSAGRPWLTSATGVVLAAAGIVLLAKPLFSA